MIKTRLVELEKRTKDVLKHLEEEVESIRPVKSLFGRHSYPVEYSLLRITIPDIQRGVMMINPYQYGGAIGDLHFFLSEKDKKRYATKWLSRARRNLERITGE